MSAKSSWKVRKARMFVVAPVDPYTWAVAFSRQIIPGAVFNSKTAAIVYAFLLASTVGLGHTSIRVLGGA
jgi:hypothetical protein